MADTFNFKTPEDFINYYSDSLKTELNTFDIQINKAGFLGYLLNILGYTNYDLKNYYDYLFKESFVATAKVDENLFLHSSIYGYQPGFATPSQASGNFSVDVSFLPAKSSNVYRREILLNGIGDVPINFSINDIPFSTSSAYKFVEEGTSNWYCVITRSDGSSMYVPSSTSNISASLYDCSQYTLTKYDIQIPNYLFNSFYTHTFTIDEGYYISDIEVYVKGKNDTSYTQYDINYVKYIVSGTDNVVFLKKLSTTSFSLEFGSGTRGTWVPNSQATIYVKVTKGLTGNVTASSETIVLSPKQITVTDYDSNNTILYVYSYSSANYIKALINYSENGKNPSTGDILREEVIKYIQTRDNMISKRDFSNITDKYLHDYSFLFRKTAVYDNIFYLLRTFRDRYQNVIRTTNHSVYQLDYTSPLTNLTATSGTVTTGTLPAGTHYYKVSATDGIGKTICTDQVSITIDGTTVKSVNLTWTALPNAERYIVYRRESNSQNMYWETFTNTFTDTGSTGIIIPSTNLPDGSVNYILWPRYYINNTSFISPFLYKYNSFMDWYDGFVFYDFLYITFSEILIIDKTDVSYSPAPIYINILYDKVLKKSTIYVKSYQELEDSLTYPMECPDKPLTTTAITLTIPELDLSNQAMTYITDINNANYKSFKYEYTDNEGLIIEEGFHINLKLSKYEIITLYDQFGTVKSTYCDWVDKTQYNSKSVTQVYNIKDQLTLVKYLNHSVTPAVKNVMNIPIMEESVFNLDQQYYLDRLKDFIVDLRFKENRMISDEVQFRFLNTYLSEAFFTIRTLIQAYNYDIKLPLKLTVDIKVNMDYVTNNSIILSDEKDKMLTEVALYLQESFTGTNIIFYNSMIVDKIHNYGFVKSAVVTVKDSNDLIITGGIEVLKGVVIDENLTPLKLDTDDVAYNKKYMALKYIPVFYWWDIDNISLNFLST